MGHGQLIGDDLLGFIIYQQTGTGDIFPPSFGSIGLAQSSQVFGFSIMQRQSIEVATVVGGEIGDK